MSMNKVIHCAVRRDLRRFGSALAAFPDGDTARATALHRAWQNFDAQLTEHHEGEHEIAWPALLAVGVDQASIRQFDEEHEAMAAALRAAGTAMAALASSGSRADADAAAAAVAHLKQVTTVHLDNEEAMSEPLFADKQMGKKFSKRGGITVAGTFFAWVQDGASPDEMAALKDSVPGPVLAIIGGLFGRRYRKEVAPVWATTGSF